MKSGTSFYGLIGLFSTCKCLGSPFQMTNDFWFMLASLLALTALLKKYSLLW